MLARNLVSSSLETLGAVVSRQRATGKHEMAYHAEGKASGQVRCQVRSHQ